MQGQDIAAAIQALHIRYISALDRRHMKDWYATFAAREDSSYTCTSAENEAAGLPVALMLDDCRARLADRVTFIEKIWAGTFQDYRTRHFLQPIGWTAEAGGALRALCNFSVMATPDDGGDSRLLVCGLYEDHIVEQGGELVFLHKKAVTDTVVLPRYIVYPI